MSESEFERQVERSRQRLAQLRECAEQDGHDADSPLNEAVEELGQTVEELSVAVEELASTNEELGEAQLATEEHARRYLDLFRQAPDAYLVTDRFGVIRELNVVAEEQFGRPARYLTGKPLLSLVSERDRDVFLEALAALRERRGRLQDRLLCFSPSAEPSAEFNASVSAMPDWRYGELEIRWMLRDVSELLEREAFRNAIESHLEPLLWLLQIDPISVLHVSLRYESVWGRSVDALDENPRDWLEAVHAEDRPGIEAAFDVFADRGATFDQEYRIVLPDGSVRWIHDRATGFGTAPGRHDRAARISEDVTEKKRIEVALKQEEDGRRAAALAAERAEARERRTLAVDLHDSVSQFLALARTKLAAVLAGNSAPSIPLHEDHDWTEQLRSIGSLIAEADERTRTLTFRLSPPILHDLGLTAAVDWLAEDLMDQFGLKVQVNEGGEQIEPLTIEIREVLFRSARELLINVARHAETKEADVRLCREGDTINIVVSDGGVGFDLGASGAAGFGLVSIRERMEALGGRLEIDSDAGRGTRARLVAPAPRSD